MCVFVHPCVCVHIFCIFLYLCQSLHLSCPYICSVSCSVSIWSGLAVLSKLSRTTAHAHVGTQTHTCTHTCICTHTTYMLLSLYFTPQGPLTIVSPLSSLFCFCAKVCVCVCVFMCVFDGKHSDQTVLNKLPELITERGGREDERGMERKEKGYRGRNEVTQWYKIGTGMCVFDPD